MKTILFDIVAYLLILTLTIIGFYLIIRLPKNTEVRYNCELSEISPDFPIEVREQCRKLRSKL